MLNVCEASLGLIRLTADVILRRQRDSSPALRMTAPEMLFQFIKSYAQRLTDKQSSLLQNIGVDLWLSGGYPALFIYTFSALSMLNSIFCANTP